MPSDKVTNVFSPEKCLPTLRHPKAKQRKENPFSTIYAWIVFSFVFERKSAAIFFSVFHPFLSSSYDVYVYDYRYLSVQPMEDDMFQSYNIALKLLFMFFRQSHYCKPFYSEYYDSDQIEKIFIFFFPSINWV